jgi:ankyrin repeat protein
MRCFRFTSGAFAQVGRVDSIAALVRRGANVDKELETGTTPLIWAGNKSELESMSALVQRGANVEYENKHGRTVLVEMASIGRLASISTLIEYCQAKPDRETAMGLTALHAAAANGQVGRTVTPLFCCPRVELSGVKRSLL